MLRFPVHPRYARMFLEAQERGCVRPVAMMAALTQGRNFLLRGVPAPGGGGARGGPRRGARERLLPAHARVALRRQERLLARRVPPPGDPRPGGAPGRAPLRAVPGDRRGRGPRRLGAPGRRHEVRKCVLAGFPDHLARGSTRDAALRAGPRPPGLLARESAIAKAPLLVAAEITEVGGGRAR